MLRARISEGASPSWCDPAGASPAQVRGSVRLVASVAWPLVTVVSEAYTAIAWGVGLSHERSDIAGAESFYSLEGNMCGTAMRGAVALPGSKATSRAKGSHRKLGDLVSGRGVLSTVGPHREGEEPKPMMHGHEKSDSVIVAVKPANKADANRCGAGGAKGGDQGECGPAKHVPGSEPDKRVTGAGPHTASRKGKEEGEVHRALPPHQHRFAQKRRSSNSKETPRLVWIG